MNYYIVYKGKIARVMASLRGALDAAFSDYDGSTQVVTLGGLIVRGLNPNNPRDWTHS